MCGVRLLNKISVPIIGAYVIGFKYSGEGGYKNADYGGRRYVSARG